MKVKITDFSKFQIDNGTYFSNEKMRNSELEVLAIFGKRKKEVLLIVENIVLDFFKLNKEFIEVIDDSISGTWKYVKRYRYDGRKNIETPEFVTLKLDDLYAPEWMLADDFLYNVIMNRDKALKVFRERKSN